MITNAHCMSIYSNSSKIMLFIHMKDEIKKTFQLRAKNVEKYIKKY